MIKQSLLIICMLVIAACGSVPPPKPEAIDTGERLMANGVQAFHAGRYLEAQRAFQRAAAHNLSLDRARETAAALISSSEILLLYSDTRSADALIEQAASEALRANDGILMLRAQLLRARWQDLVGNPEIADAMATEIIKGASGTSPALVMQAQLLRCKLAVAAGTVECTQTMNATDPLMMARLERLRAQAALQANDGLTANEHFDKALNIYRQNFYRPGIAASYEEKAAVEIARLNELSMEVAAIARLAAQQDLERALFIRLWMQDRVHVIAVLDLLQEASASADEAAHWAGWRNYLVEDVAPDWGELEQNLRLKLSN